jgi:hypothetical protein
MKASGQLQVRSRFAEKKKNSGTLWIGGWVGPRVGLNALTEEKKIHFLPLQGIKSRSSSRQPSHYTN